MELGAACTLESEVGNQLNFRLSEYAVLQDGRTLVLHSDRGLSIGVPRTLSGEVADAWDQLTVEILERNALTALLPDDDDDEAHPYTWFVQLLAERGVVSSEAELRRAPYRVNIDEAVMRRIGDP